MGFLLIRVERPYLVAVPSARNIEGESRYSNFPLKNLVNPLFSLRVLLFMEYFCYNRCFWKLVKFTEIITRFVYSISRNSFWNNTHFWWSFTMANGWWKRLYLKLKKHECFATQDKEKIQVQSRWINWSTFIRFLRSLLSSGKLSNSRRSHAKSFRENDLLPFLFSVKPFKLVYFFS